MSETVNWTEDLPVMIVEKIKAIFTSVTFVWFATLYFFSTLCMIIFNITRVGFAEGIQTAHSYYADLFLFYGLNRLSEFQSPWLEGFGAIVMAPFLCIFMGLALFLLKDAGYSINGNTRAQDFLLPVGDPSYAFYKEDVVYGANVLLFGMKGNLFYIGIVWIPIILASIATIIYKRRAQKSTNIVQQFTVNLVISIWLGIAIAKMTDPELSFNWEPIIPAFGMENAFSLIAILAIALGSGLFYYIKVVRGASIPKKLSFIVLVLFSYWFLMAIVMLVTPGLRENIVVGGFYQSMIVDRRNNLFVEFDGQYHPTTTAFMLTLFQLVPMLVLILIQASLGIYGTVNSQLEQQRLRKEYQQSRMAGGISRLPWEGDSPSPKPLEEEAK